MTNGANLGYGCMLGWRHSSVKSIGSKSGGQTRTCDLLQSTIWTLVGGLEVHTVVLYSWCRAHVQMALQEFQSLRKVTQEQKTIVLQMCRQQSSITLTQTFQTLSSIDLHWATTTFFLKLNGPSSNQGCTPYHIWHMAIYHIGVTRYGCHHDRNCTVKKKCPSGTVQGFIWSEMGKYGHTVQIHC